MTLYVDESIWPYRGQLYCHLYSDSGPDELHSFAQAIGLRRSWFQDKPYFPHYDLSPKLRAIAIRNGATAITTKEMVNLKRQAQGLGALEEVAKPLMMNDEIIHKWQHDQGIKG